MIRSKLFDWKNYLLALSFVLLAYVPCLSQEVELGEVMLERDMAELEDFREVIISMVNSEVGEEQVLRVMQREVMQLQQKLSSARIETGKSKADINQGLQGLGNRPTESDKKAIRKSVKYLKDDQQDLKKLDRLLASEKTILARFESGKEKEAQIKLANEFAEIMDKDLYWTRQELQEDKYQGGN